MQQTVFTVFILAAVIASGQPQELPAGVKLAPVVPPPIVLSRFAEEYKDHNSQPSAGWRQDGENYTVKTQNKSGLPVILVYDKDGKKLREDRKIAISETPSPVREKLRDPDTGAAEVWQRRDTSALRYFAPRQQDTLWFDEKGIQPK
jgi:hypothetical protein